ncbi:MAG TPA: chorismate mutase [Trueperaceae bacterium]
MSREAERPFWVRGIRGATTVERDDPELVLEATGELLEEMLRANGIEEFEPIAAIFFTTTPDISSTFPAEAARRLGMSMVPLLCNQEIPVPDRLPLAIRVMMQLNTRKSQAEMRHIYLREAKSLRPDLVSAQ